MDAVWWSMMGCWAILAFAIRSQQELGSTLHPHHHDDRAKRFKLLVIGSVVVASLASLGLAYLHYSAFGLLWTMALGIGGGLLGAVVWGALSAMVGDLLLALASFVLWPLAAIGFYLLLRVAEA